MPSSTMKTCSRCRRRLDESNFYSSYSNRMLSNCQQCVSYRKPERNRTQYFADLAAQKEVTRCKHGKRPKVYFTTTSPVDLWGSAWNGAWWIALRHSLHVMRTLVRLNRDPWRGKMSRVCASMLLRSRYTKPSEKNSRSLPTTWDDALRRGACVLLQRVNWSRSCVWSRKFKRVVSQWSKRYGESNNCGVDGKAEGTTASVCHDRPSADTRNMLSGPHRTLLDQ